MKLENSTWPKFASFDVKSLVTNVPLEGTTNITILYVKINTNISKSDMNPFFWNEIYLETDGVAMGSPLVGVGIFMMKLGKILVPELNKYLKI